MKKIKYGVIGCGAHSRMSHALPGKEIPDLELTSLYDISLPQMQSFEKEYGTTLKKHTDLNKFFNSEIDAVLIGSPDEFHFNQLQTALTAGKHVFIEKPLATNTNELQPLMALLDYSTDNNLLVSSCHPRRLDPPFIWLKEKLTELNTSLGKVISFTFDFSYHQPVKAWKHERGLVLDHANHEIDLLHYLFDYKDFEANRLVDSYNRYCITGNRTDDMNFVFSGTRTLSSKRYLEFSSLRFERGLLNMDSINGIATLVDHENNSTKTYGIPKTDYQLRGKRTLENFVKAIRGVEDCYLSSRDLYINTAMSVNLSERANWKCYWR